MNTTWNIQCTASSSTKSSAAAPLIAGAAISLISPSSVWPETVQSRICRASNSRSFWRGDWLMSRSSGGCAFQASVYGPVISSSSALSALRSALVMLVRTRTAKPSSPG